jgi:hypothetical protein
MGKKSQIFLTNINRSRKGMSSSTTTPTLDSGSRTPLLNTYCCHLLTQKEEEFK